MIQIYELIYGVDAYNIIFGDIIRNFTNIIKGNVEITNYFMKLYDTTELIENTNKLEKIKVKAIEEKEKKKLKKLNIDKSQSKIISFIHKK